MNQQALEAKKAAVAAVVTFSDRVDAFVCADGHIVRYPAR